MDDIEAQHRLKRASSKTKKAKKAYEEAFKSEKDLIQEIHEESNLSLGDIAKACGRQKAHIWQIVTNWKPRGKNE